MNVEAQIHFTSPLFNFFSNVFDLGLDEIRRAGVQWCGQRTFVNKYGGRTTAIEFKNSQQEIETTDTCTIVIKMGFTYHTYLDCIAIFKTKL